MTPRPEAKPEAEELVRRLLAGERRALARAISLVEDGTTVGHLALALLYSHTGRAHTVGITGGSGTGKSTLAGALALEFRRRGRTIGVVAVDPTSPFSHGALLGDRIRMPELARDPEIFVRSMATRGELGGLASATAEVVAVLDAAGKELVLIETVGAGQDEVEVASTAETTVVVLTPGGGDGVQAMKAGIMEVADILVVNKADLPGADAVVSQLQAMTAMDARGGPATPVLETVATKGDGVAELADAIEEHRRQQEASGELEEQRLERARRQVLALARHELLAGVVRATERDGRLEELVASVARRELDPYAAAQRLINAADGGT
ncbi:MAG: methylmalonyl Co-A mutase-associated GTPase MeaB [Chloroflexi bacterium]|nr:methylmalonyl Co-A mutase-associated GTPase MeaB [Chloroflexota bacterium]